MKRPNRYQTIQRFIEQWILSKLLHGNSYALKERDQRGIVTALYILDPSRVYPLVAEDGGVYYQLSADTLAQLPEGITVPASEIIHDRMLCLFHPLVGVSPLYACALSTTMGNKIQSNSTKFFDNMSRPSGALTAPGTISDETAGRLKKAWEENFGGNNIGRLAILGDGLTYEPMTIPAQESQLLEQLDWTVKDVARAFHMPLFKLGGPEPARVSVESLNQTYYTDCLQTLIESFETLMDDGLALPTHYYTELDLEALLRMDTAARHKSYSEAITGGWLAPNEARRKENYKPAKGGDAPMMQQQNYSLEALAKRDASADPFKKDAPAPAAAPATGGNDGNDGENKKKTQLLLTLIEEGLTEELTT